MSKTFGDDSPEQGLSKSFTCTLLPRESILKELSINNLVEIMFVSTYFIFIKSSRDFP